MSTTLTAAAAARRLGLSRSILARYCRDGRLPAVKAGRDWRILPADLDRFVREPRPKGNPQFRA